MFSLFLLVSPPFRRRLLSNRFPFGRRHARRPCLSALGCPQLAHGNRMWVSGILIRRWFALRIDRPRPLAGCGVSDHLGDLRKVPSFACSCWHDGRVTSFRLIVKRKEFQTEPLPSPALSSIKVQSSLICIALLQSCRIPDDCGNGPTRQVETLLRSRLTDVAAFLADPSAAILQLP